MKETPVRFHSGRGMNRAYRAREVFAPYYRLLNELREGEVTCVGDMPVVEWKGELEYAAPVLHGFVAVWERVQRQRPCDIDLGPLTVLAHRIDGAGLLTEDEIRAARDSLDDCLRAYKRLPLELIASCANTEEIVVKMEVISGCMAPSREVAVAHAMAGVNHG